MLPDETTALLIRARGFIERGWCQRKEAQDAAGFEISPTSEFAVAWCMNGALWAAGVYETHCGASVLHRLSAALSGESIHVFNNRQKTVEPVLAAFDRAIAGEPT